MPSQEDINIQKQKNESTLRFGRLLLILVALAILTTTFFTFRFYQVINANKNILTTLTKNTEDLHDIITVIEDIIYKDAATPTNKKKQILEDFNAIEKNHDKLIAPEIVTHIKNSDIEFYQKSLQTISKNYSDLVGISTLILSQKKGVFENKEIITTQLISNKRKYISSLNDLNNWANDTLINQSNNLVYVILSISFLFIILITLAYFSLIKPIKKNVIYNHEMSKKWFKEIESNQLLVKKSEAARIESELFLKTKKAQVIKLQQSLEEAIYRSEMTNNSKKQIYYEIASELEQHNSFLMTHFQVIENQTDVSGHENWVQLSHNLERLSNLVTKYYESAQEGGTITPKQEVYLSPLISEVIISKTTNGNVNFKQLEDLPTILTDEIALKRVLLPFFEFISSCTDIKTVQISASQKKNTCEFKFVGLPQSFKKLWDSKTSQDDKNPTRSTFKLQFAINSISNRGGKTWTQFDIGKNGVLIISWVL